MMTAIIATLCSPADDAPTTHAWPVGELARRGRATDSGNRKDIKLGSSCAGGGGDADGQVVGVGDSREGDVHPVDFDGGAWGVAESEPQSREVVEALVLTGGEEALKDDRSAVP
jgi:hypothetical protein